MTPDQQAGIAAAQFRARVLEAVRRTIAAESLSVRDFAHELGDKHVKALGLITREDYSAIRAGLGAWKRKLEAEVAIAKMIAVAERLERLVQAGETRYADEELAP